MSDFPESKLSPCCNAEAWDLDCPDCETTGENEDGNECPTCNGDGYIQGWCECSECGDTFECI